MTLAERLSEYVRACFTGIWVQSFEHDDAIAEIARLCRQQGWALATWDVDRGLALAGRRRRPSTAVPAPPTRWPRSGRSAPWPRPTARRCWCSRNFHRFLGSAEVVQALDTPIAAGKQDRTFVVDPVAGRPDPGRAGEAVRRRRARPARPRPARGRSPARSPPSPASCPRATAWTPCSTRRPG